MGNVKWEPYVCMMTNSTCYKNTRKMTIKGVLWHDTGCNNPWLSRYVQPLETDKNYAQAIAKLGKNRYGNDWNHTAKQAGLNCWIGKFADGSVGTVQAMPWDYRPWGCGAGSKGSCNDGWIQFEICEDAKNDKEYAQKCWDEAIKCTAWLCETYNIDPMGKTTLNGVTVPTILCHWDSYLLKLGSGHDDIYDWFPKILGKNMDDVRKEVQALIKKKVGWVEIDGKWYYYDKDGNVTIDWAKINKKWYYFNKDGVMQEGWIKDDGKWYYLVPEKGYMKTGWVEYENEWYYCDKKTGAMVKGWQLINNVYYFFRNNGIMAHDEWVYTLPPKEGTKKAYFNLNKDGKWLNQYAGMWKKDDKGRRFKSGEDTYLTNTTARISQKDYKFDKNGYATEIIPPEPDPYKVKVTCDVLNIRSGPGTSYDIVGSVKKGDVYTIVDTQDNWGKLKSGAGWICLDYTEKV